MVQWVSWAHRHLSLWPSRPRALRGGGITTFPSKLSEREKVVLGVLSPGVGPESLMEIMNGVACPQRLGAKVVGPCRAKPIYLGGVRMSLMFVSNLFSAFQYTENRKRQQ